MHPNPSHLLRTGYMHFQIHLQSIRTQIHTHRHLSIKVLLLLQQQMLFEFPFDLQ